MSQIAVKFYKVLNPPAEPAEANAVYLVQPDVNSVVDIYVTDVDGNIFNVGNAAFVLAAVAASMALKAPLASPEFSGVPTAPTAAAGTDTEQLATCEFVAGEIADIAGDFAPLADPAFTGNPTVPTQTAGNNTTRIANTAFVTTAIANLINSAPGALDTLDELAAAFGDDPNFAATMTTALAGKQPLDATLTALAALTIAANSLTIGSGADAFSQVTFAANRFPARASSGSLEAKTITDFALSILDDADAGAARSTLGAAAALLTVAATDGTATGPQTNALNAGYASAVGDLVYLDGSGTWQKTDANLSAGYDKLLGIALEAKTSGQAMLVALPGSTVYAATAFPTLTIGSPVYMSETAGAITHTKPTTTDAAIRVIGWAVHADKLYFYPSQDYITHT